MANDAKILIVDDNEINIKVFKGLLEPLKMQIDTAENGKVAVEMVENHPYHMVFMDHMMPVMDGIEATRRIRKNGKESLPIIALSANATKDAKKMFLEKGFDGFVSKPFRMKDMLSILREYLPAELCKSSDTVLVSEDKEKELSHQIQVDYYRLIDAKAEKIQELWEHRQLRDFTIEVHGLKSSSRLIGADHLGEQFYRLEKLGNEENLEEIEKLLPEIIKEFLEYKKVLQPYIIEEEKVMRSKEEILQILQKMKDSADIFDMDQVDAFMSHLRNSALPDDLKAVVRNLDTYIADVDLEQIIIVVTELMEEVGKKNEEDFGHQ